MTIPELFERLSEENFQDPDTGNLSFPVYMYFYDPTEEYFIREEVQNLKDRLKRPTSYQDVLIIDIFDLFLAYLSNKTFGKKSFLDYLLEKEKDMPDKVHNALVQEAKSASFFDQLNQHIQSHLQKPGENGKSLVFLHGIGKIFPYLRASKFISNFEKYISGYKLVIFYPGKDKGYLSLFDLLGDEHSYRSTKLINN